MVALKRDQERTLAIRMRGKQERRGGIETALGREGHASVLEGSRNAVVALKRT